ncbi:hypothetical protein MYAM1_000573 [Malassezia yamatoensis]|uniref:Smr domain-containing protein n=1 Tax=Malassezia yamatoensis TaxID=253288 RepID=A0AAJ5YUI7_9BASI|nr:hypothetical protein MYAM1_000573 [Malassezia yamatoensis]
MEDPVNQEDLVKRFCPPLDPSLVLAICSETERSQDDQIQILVELAQTVNLDQPASLPTEPNPTTQGFDPNPAEDLEGASEKQATLTFLAQSFPDRTVETLEKVLNKAEGNVDTAMDELLSENLLASVSIRANKQASQSGLDYDALAEGMRGKKTGRSKTKQTAGRKPQKVSLTDQRSANHIYAERRNVAKASTVKAASPDIIDTEGLDDAEIARRLQIAEKDAIAANEKLVGDQQWLLASSALTQLASLLDVSSQKMQSIFNHASFNLHVTMARAIAFAAEQTAALDAMNKPEFHVVCDTLAKVTDRDPRVIRQVLAATKGEQASALDLLQLQDVVAKAAEGVYNRPDLLDPTAQVGSDIPSVALHTPTVTQKRVVGQGPGPRWLDTQDRSYASRSAQADSRLDTKLSAFSALQQGQAAVVLPMSAQRVELDTNMGTSLEGTYSNEECLQRADELREKRNAALRQAASSARRYRGANATLGGAASVYAEEARKYDAAARRWQMRAASALVEQRQTDAMAGGHASDMERVDLHGLTVHEALTVVQQVLARSSRSSGRTFLEIVTGRGVHSRHNVSVIRPAIVRYLQQQGYTIDSTSNPGVLYVKQTRS